MLELAGVTKRFGTNEVLHSVDLEIRSNEFIGLMGPNGAGKSTLIKILDGVYPATKGTIKIAGQPVDSLRGHGDVAFIHQDLALVDRLSISDNLQLSEPPVRRLGVLLNRRAEAAKTRSALEGVGLERAPDTPLEDLTAGEKTLVAVARAMSRGAKILFVDETTSTLPPNEAKRVIASLAAMVEGGAAVVMVTHKLSEILDATGRVVVLIDGEIVADEQTSSLERADLVRLLFRHQADAAARTSDEIVSEPAPMGADSDAVVVLRGATGGRAGPIDLELRPGEIVGLTGLPGSGLHDVGFLVHGSLRPTSGTVEVASSTQRSIVPPHREADGGFGDRPVRLNLTISSLHRWAGRTGLMSGPRERADAAEACNRLSLQPRDDTVDFDVLSGGNKQKVILGRAMLAKTQVLVLCEPTRGVDVRTRAEIYALIAEAAAGGAAVLVTSSDTEDLLAVCHRVGVVRGTLSPLRPVADMTLADLEAIV